VVNDPLYRATFPSGRRAEKDFHAFGGEQGQDSVEQRRFADAGPASDHRDLVQRPENR